jgi:hypothetical protein
VRGEFRCELRRTELQEASQLRNIESDHDLPIDDAHRRGHIAEFFQFAERSLIGSNVSIHEADVVPGKKLFHLAAEHSTRLGVNDNLLAH